MIAPEEWGRSKSFSKSLSTVRLLSDSTWDILDKTSFNFDALALTNLSNQDA